MEQDSFNDILGINLDDEDFEEDNDLNLATKPRG
jgi:hypothetical protein